MEWCRTRRKGGVSQYLTIQVYDALETLRFGCVFVCKLPIDRRGPITEGIDILPVQRGGQPFLRADPANRFPRAEVDDMRATAKSVQAGTGTGQGILCRDPDYAAWPRLRPCGFGHGHATVRHNQSDSRKASS